MSRARPIHFFLALAFVAQSLYLLQVRADDSVSRLPAAEVIKISNSIETLNSDPYRPTTHELNRERSGSRMSEQEKRRRFVEEALGGGSLDMSSESSDKQKPNSDKQEKTK